MKHRPDTFLSIRERQVSMPHDLPDRAAQAADLYRSKPLLKLTTRVAFKEKACIPKQVDVITAHSIWVEGYAGVEVPPVASGGFRLNYRGEEEIDKLIEVALCDVYVKSRPHSEPGQQKERSRPSLGMISTALRVSPANRKLPFRDRRDLRPEVTEQPHLRARRIHSPLLQPCLK